jgi:hypothetical protein
MADWKHELRLEVEHLTALLNQKEQLEVKIAKRRQRVAALELLAKSDDDPGSDAVAYVESIVDIGGLTDACRAVLRGSRKGWMTISEIQAGLKDIGFPLEKYKAPYASISTTVNRMTEGANRDVVVERRSNPGATEYKWVGPNYGAPNSLANRIADHDREIEKMKPSQELSAAVQRRIGK